MYYISETWNILLLILIPAKYLKDVFCLSNRAANRGEIFTKEVKFLSYSQTFLIVTAF